MLWPDCCQIMTFVTRLLSKLWISWPDYCQNNKYCDQIGVKKLEALHLMCLRCAPRLLWEDNQCNMILQLLQQIPIILVRNDFAASPATNPNNFWSQTNIFTTSDISMSKRPTGILRNQINQHLFLIDLNCAFVVLTI